MRGRARSWQYFCPSCQAKRAALFAEHFVEVVRQPVAYRHVVFTIPKALRGLFERDRRLLSILSRSAYDALRGGMQADIARRDALPGVVASIQTLGSFGNWHPHIHALVSAGLFERGGGFLPLEAFPTEAIETRFRRLLLKRLVRAERLSEAFMERLLSWHHSGFSVHVGEELAPSDPQATERVSRYLVRAPVALGKVHPQVTGASSCSRHAIPPRARMRGSSIPWTGCMRSPHRSRIRASTWCATTARMRIVLGGSTAPRARRGPRRATTMKRRTMKRLRVRTTTNPRSLSGSRPGAVPGRV